LLPVLAVASSASASAIKARARDRRPDRGLVEMTSVHQFTRNRANFCPVLVDEPRGLILSFGDGIDRGMEPLRERLNFSIVVGAKRIKFGTPSAKPALRCATASQFDHGATGDF
jgi:hypothetical protein